MKKVILIVLLLLLLGCYKKIYSSSMYCNLTGWENYDDNECLIVGNKYCNCELINYYLNESTNQYEKNITRLGVNYIVR